MRTICAHSKEKSICTEKRVLCMHTHKYDGFFVQIFFRIEQKRLFFAGQSHRLSKHCIYFVVIALHYSFCVSAYPSEKSRHSLGASLGESSDLISHYHVAFLPGFSVVAAASVCILLIHTFLALCWFPTPPYSYSCCCLIKK